LNTILWLKKIPNNSKLLLIGDLFKQKNREWRIIGYYLTEDRRIISHSVPIDALPILTMGSTFPLNDTNRVLNGFTGRWSCPHFTGHPDGLKLGSAEVSGRRPFQAAMGMIFVILLEPSMKRLINGFAVG